MVEFVERSWKNGSSPKHPLRMAIEASSTCGEISPRAYNTKTKFLILGDTKEEENLWITVGVSLRRYFVIHQLRLISLRKNLK
jgi:hypothetical protein